MNDFDSLNKFSKKTIKPKNTAKSITKACTSLLIATSVLYTGASLMPTNEVKTQQEIARSVKLLDAVDSYYSSTNTFVYDKTNKTLDEIKYKPLVLPKGTKEVKIIVDKDFAGEDKIAIKDSLEEYNDILLNANQNFKFKLYNEGTIPNICDIVVDYTNFEGYTGVNKSLPLLNKSTAFNRIYIDNSDKSYHTVRATFSHELMHYFGAGDLYVYNLQERSKVDSIMGFYDHSTNVLQENDIKFFFATLDNVSTKEDVIRVNSYINSHLKKYNYVRQQGQKLKEKYGEEYLANQITKITKQNVNLNEVSPSNLYLLDKINYNAKTPTLNCNLKGIHITQDNCYSLDIKHEFTLKSTESRDFLDNYYIYDCGDFYAVFDNNGNLINLMHEASKKDFNSYYSNLFDDMHKLDELIM